ncbi:MAG: hypothetical protein AB7K64_07485 [Variibacter sp.]
MTIAEIAERDATGAVADAYARLRRTLNVSVVNFIWRHLATLDGALAFGLPVIERAKPVIDGAVMRVTQEADALVDDGLATSEAIAAPPAVRDVIAAYDRGNSWNMLAMTVLAAARRGEALALTPAAPAPAFPPPQVPPYPCDDAVAPDLKAIIARLATAGPAAASGVRPSLWVHLALWPDVLRAIAPRCIDVLASPTFRTAYDDFCGRGAAILGLSVPAPIADPPDAEDAVDRAIRIFRMRIPEMVLIGRILLRDIGGRDAPPA